MCSEQSPDRYRPVGRSRERTCEGTWLSGLPVAIEDLKAFVIENGFGAKESPRYAPVASNT